MPGVTTTRRLLREGMDPEPLARLAGRDDLVFGQSGILTPPGTNTGIDLYIFEVNSNTALYSLLEIDPATGNPEGGEVIFDTLQTDGRWKADAIGYNFRYPIRKAETASSFTFEGGHLYAVEFTFHTALWGDIVHVWEYEVVSTYSR